MGRSTICKICVSPYRKEIVALHKQGYNSKDIYIRYSKKLDYKASPNAFYKLIYSHVKNNHKEDAVLVRGEANSSLSAATLENFGQRMLELGMAKIETLDPTQVALKDVISAQKLILDSKKLKLGEGALMLMMRKMFAPPELNELKGAIDGTTV